jgi:hypothetical protein
VSGFAVFKGGEHRTLFYGIVATIGPAIVKCQMAWRPRSSSCV